MDYHLDICTIREKRQDNSRRYLSIRCTSCVCVSVLSERSACDPLHSRVLVRRVRNRKIARVIHCTRHGCAARRRRYFAARLTSRDQWLDCRIFNCMVKTYVTSGLPARGAHALSSRSVGVARRERLLPLRTARNIAIHVAKISTAQRRRSLRLHLGHALQAQWPRRAAGWRRARARRRLYATRPAARDRDLLQMVCITATRAQDPHCGQPRAAAARRVL